MVYEYLKHLCLRQRIGLFHHHFLKVKNYVHNEFNIIVYRQINQYDLINVKI